MHSEIAYEKDLSVIRAVQFDASQKDCTASQSEIIAQADETWRQVNGITIDTLNAIGRVVVHLGTMPGRRELLLASSGFLAGPNQELKDKIIDRALRSDVVINALDAKGIYGEALPGVRPQDARVHGNAVRVHSGCESVDHDSRHWRCRCASRL